MVCEERKKACTKQKMFTKTVLKKRERKKDWFEKIEGTLSRRKVERDKRERMVVCLGREGKREKRGGKKRWTERK